MPIAFPSGLDDFNNPTSSDNLNTTGVEHHLQHANANDAIEAIEKILVGPVWVNVKAHGAVGDGVADDTSGIQAALDAAVAGGGQVFIPTGTYLISGVVSVPRKVDLVGAAPELTTIKCSSAGARLRFGERAPADGLGGYRGGVSGGFTVDGNNVATNPFFIGRSVQRSFRDMTVRNSAGHGVVLEETQNCRFFNFQSESNADTQIVFDYGASANQFYGTEISLYFRGKWGVKFLQSGVAATGIPTEPRHNVFWGGLIEQAGQSTTDALGYIYHGAGIDNEFYQVQIAATSVATASMPVEAPTYFPLLQMRVDGARPSTRLRFGDCRFQGDTAQTLATAVDTGAGSHIIFIDNCLFTNLNRGFFIGDLTRVEVARLEQPSVSTLFQSQGGTTGANDRLVNRVTGAQPLKVPAASFTANATLAETHHTALVSAAGAARTVTLPLMAANLRGRQFTVKKTDSSANAVTVSPNGGTIDGAATYSLASQYKYVTVVADGTNWFVIANN